jgi:hypothetical protein
MPAWKPGHWGYDTRVDATGARQMAEAVLDEDTEGGHGGVWVQ